MNCEKLIIKRFLETFNSEKETSFNYKNCFKKDELPEFRSKKTYDYHCRDEINNKEMGIEVKRLIPEHRKRIINLNHKVKEVESRFKSVLTGDFLLVISPYIFIYKRAQALKKAFDVIAKEIASVADSLPQERLHNLSSFKGVGLVKYSENKTEFNLNLMPISFASASSNEIVRALKDALKKFEEDFDGERINIILLVELSSVVKRTKIRSMIKNLEVGIDNQEMKFREKYNFSIINGIYQIGIGKKAVIAQVYPKIKEFGFYPDERKEEAIWLYEHCLDYFLH